MAAQTPDQPEFRIRDAAPTDTASVEAISLRAVRTAAPIWASHGEHEARELGGELFTLHVYTGNARAQALYERSGFQPEWLRMRRPLT